jgi:cell wall-associated NlpC family hydrolase
MSSRDDARPGAPTRSTTALSALAGHRAAQLGPIGRTGAFVAMSSGLIAAMAVPAGATGSHLTVAPVSLDTAITLDRPVAAANFAAAPGSSVGSLLATSTPATGLPISAPLTATVGFEEGGFSAVPTPPPVRKTTPPAPRHAQAAPASTRRAPAVAKASRSRSSTASTSAGSARGSSVLSVAARYVGTPYRYGGTTPAGFDCSGFTRYVYKQLGHSLPRTAHQQLGATKRVSRSSARPGDLVFFVSSGRAYHVGIYAGGNKMYDAPRAGKTLSKRAIWSSAVVFGRVTG